MFDRIAARYDLLNRLLSLGLDGYWRRALIRRLGPRPLERILDVATGTADVAMAIARHLPESSVVGLDPSVGMLKVGQHKLEQADLSRRVHLIDGDAQRLPFDDECFDAAVISFGIRNVPDRLLGLKEMCRVVRPGGRVVVLELSEPRDGWLSAPARFYLRRVVPWLGAKLSGSREYDYLQRSIRAFPRPDQFTAMLEEAGLEQVERLRLSFGVAQLYWGVRDSS